MKYDVQIDKEKYIVEAPNTYEAKLQAAHQHVKKYPMSFASATDVLTRSKIIVTQAQNSKSRASSRCPDRLKAEP